MTPNPVKFIYVMYDESDEWGRQHGIEVARQKALAAETPAVKSSVGKRIADLILWMLAGCCVAMAVKLLL